MQIIAVECGVDSSQYWSMTPRDVSAAITAYNSKEAREFQTKTKTLDMLLWIAGRYNSFAANAPKKYPTKPYLSKENNPKSDKMTDDEMESWARRFCESY